MCKTRFDSQEIILKVNSNWTLWVVFGCALFWLWLYVDSKRPCLIFSYFHVTCFVFWPAHEGLSLRWATQAMPWAGRLACRCRNHNQVLRAASAGFDIILQQLFSCQSYRIFCQDYEAKVWSRF